MEEFITFNYEPYKKIIVLKTGDFLSEIIDERNFGVSDEKEMAKFKYPYIRRDDCHIVELLM